MSIFVRIIVLCLTLIFLSPLFALTLEAIRSLSTSETAFSTGLLAQYGWTTLFLVLGSVVGSLLFGCTCAYLCSRFEFRARKLLLILSILPLGVPSYLVAYTWVDVLVDAGVHGGGLRTLPLTCFIFSICLSPYVFLPTYAALSGLSASLIESSRVLGKNHLQTFFSVELPLVRASVLAGGLLTAMEVLADFGTVDFMAIDTWTTGIFRSWFGYGDRGRSALLALVLFAFSGLLVFVESRLRAGRTVAAGSRSLASVRRRELRGGMSMALIAFAAVPGVLGCLAPAGLLLQRSFSAADATLWLTAIKPAVTTLLVAGGAGSIVVLIGFLFAFVLRSSFGRIWNISVRLSSLGYALPGSVIGIGLLVLLAPFSLTGSLIGLVLAYCVRFAAVGTSPIESGWLGIPRTFEEQAKLLGCTPLGVVKRVSLPLLKKSIGCAFVLTCIDVVKELPATMLLRPFDFETLSIRTYNLASDERLSETAPSSLLMIVLCVLGVLIAHRLGAFGLSQRRDNGYINER